MEGVVLAYFSYQKLLKGFISNLVLGAKEDIHQHYTTNTTRNEEVWGNIVDLP
jgi:hypothetical protein